MALTDAISVACKALGFGADIYWEAGRTKYNADPPEQNEEYTCAQCGKTIRDGRKKTAALGKRARLRCTRKNGITDSFALSA